MFPDSAASRLNVLARARHFAARASKSDFEALKAHIRQRYRG
jgi:hypothetical protein